MDKRRDFLPTTGAFINDVTFNGKLVDNYDVIIFLPFTTFKWRHIFAELVDLS